MAANNEQQRQPLALSETPTPNTAQQVLPWTIPSSDASIDTAPTRAALDVRDDHVAHDDAHVLVLQRLWQRKDTSVLQGSG